MCIGIALLIERKGEMVEGTPEAVDGIPNQVGPVIRYSSDSRYVGGPPGLGIVLFDNAIRITVQPPANGVIQSVDVVECPVEPSPVAFHGLSRSLAHEATLSGLRT